MADPRSHAHHDRFAIAAAISGGSLPATVATCPACGSLFDDLLVLRHAIQGAWAPRRVRDHRLPGVDGTRRWSRWRALLGMIGSRRDTVTRPVATALTALGLVGVLLTAAPAFSLGSGAAERGADAGIMAAPDPAVISARPSEAPATAGMTDRPPSLPDRSSGTLLLSVGSLTLGLGLFGLRRSAGRRRVR